MYTVAECDIQRQIKMTARAVYCLSSLVTYTHRNLANKVTLVRAA